MDTLGQTSGAKRQDAQNGHWGSELHGWMRSKRKAGAVRNSRACALGVTVELSNEMEVGRNSGKEVNVMRYSGLLGALRSSNE